MVSPSDTPSLSSLALPRPLTHQIVLAQLNAQLDTLHTFKVRSLSLFGSVARNEATPNSDLDFLVEFEGSPTLRGYMGLKFFLEELFGCSVDLVSKRKLHPQIRKTVLEEAVRVA